jgi:hypothetical protein
LPRFEKRYNKKLVRDINYNVTVRSFANSLHFEQCSASESTSKTCRFLQAPQKELTGFCRVKLMNNSFLRQAQPLAVNTRTPSTGVETTAIPKVEMNMFAADDVSCYHGLSASSALPQSMIMVSPEVKNTGWDKSIPP